MFRKKVLDMAMREINELTTLSVSYDLEKIGRRRGAVIFHISGEIKETPKSEIKKQIISKLEYYGFQKKQIKHLLKVHDEDYLMANIGVIEEQLEQGKNIKNVRAYMSKAFQVDFRKTENEFDKIKQEKQLLKDAETEQAKQKELEKAALKETFKDTRKAKLEELKATFSETELAGLKTDFEEGLFANEFFKKVYKSKGFNFGAIQTQRHKYLAEKFLPSEYHSFANYSRENSETQDSAE